MLIPEKFYKVSKPRKYTHTRPDGCFDALALTEGKKSNSEVIPCAKTCTICTLWSTLFLCNYVSFKIRLQMSHVPTMNINKEHGDAETNDWTKGCSHVQF